MVAKTEEQSSVLDTVKLLISIVILVSGVFGFYYFEDESQLLRVLGVIAMSVLSFVVVTTTMVGQKGLGFARDARIEVRKVVWPTRQETVQTTLAVLVMVLIVAIMLWLVDMFLGWGVRNLLA